MSFEKKAMTEIRSVQVMLLKNKYRDATLLFVNPDTKRGKIYAGDQVSRPSSDTPRILSVLSVSGYAGEDFDCGFGGPARVSSSAS